MVAVAVAVAAVVGAAAAAPVALVAPAVAHAPAVLAAAPVRVAVDSVAPRLNRPHRFDESSNSSVVPRNSSGTETE